MLLKSLPGISYLIGKGYLSEDFVREATGGCPGGLCLRGFVRGVYALIRIFTMIDLALTLVCSSAIHKLDSNGLFKTHTMSHRTVI